MSIGNLKEIIKSLTDYADSLEKSITTSDKIQKDYSNRIKEQDKAITHLDEVILKLQRECIALQATISKGK